MGGHDLLGILSQNHCKRLTQTGHTVISDVLIYIPFSFLFAVLSRAELLEMQKVLRSRREDEYKKNAGLKTD